MGVLSEYLLLYMPSNNFNVQFYPNVPLAYDLDITFANNFLSSAQFLEATILFSVYSLKVYFNCLFKII